MKTDEKTNFQKSDAYWISPKGEVFPVKMKHINFIRDNLGIFNFTEEYYRSAYLKYGEKFGFEGKARAEIMLNVMRNGWIRLRNNGNSGWVIECWELDDNSRKSLQNWGNEMVKTSEGIVGINTPIKIHILKLQQEKMRQNMWIIETNFAEISKVLTAEKILFSNYRIKL